MRGCEVHSLNWVVRLGLLIVDYLVIHNFSCARLGVVHSAGPCKGICSFQTLGNTASLFHLLKKKFISLLRLLVDVGKVGV